MEPLLLAGYTTLFVSLFGYVAYLQRRLRRLEQRVTDVGN
ncbi:CcmD family protein [Halorussus salinisoli]|nr:CcmD family protein [Halorussus salinisoli]